MILDGHCHIVDDPAPILAQMEALGIQRTVLVGIGVKDLRVVTVRNTPLFRSHALLKTVGMWQARRLVASRGMRDNLLSRPRNDAVLRAIRAHPDRFSGFCFINPEDPAAAGEFNSCLDAGMCGLKLALLQYPTDLTAPPMARLCDIADARHVPVFIHLGITPAASNLAALVRRFPRLPFIVAHMGVQCFHETLDLAREFQNVFLDTSSYIATRAKIRLAYRRMGSRRIVFGTDLPVMCRDPREAIRKITSLRIAESDQQAILGGNLRELLNLP